MTKLNHTVMFKLHDGVSQEQREAALSRLTDLGTEPGIVSWVIKESIDTRKGHIIIEQAVFESQEAFETFRVSPAHTASGEVMREIADWWVADYYE